MESLPIHYEVNQRLYYERGFQDMAMMMPRFF